MGPPSVTAASASTILPVTVLPLVVESGLPLPMMAFLKAEPRKRENSEATSAALPAAWGAAIEVPLKSKRTRPLGLAAGSRRGGLGWVVHN